jgi:magnesium-transporting ATPase (P-type)
MDTLAAIALGSERPHPSIIKSPPFKEKEQVVTKVMWRQIFGVSAYIVLVMILQFFFADNMWGIDYKDTYGWVYSEATL